MFCYYTLLHIWFGMIYAVVFFGGILYAIAKFILFTRLYTIAYPPLHTPAQKVPYVHRTARILYSSVL